LHPHHGRAGAGCSRRLAIIAVSGRALAMSATALYKIVLVIVFLVVIFELGQALYFMMTDRSGSNRTAWALTRRVLFSALLIVLIIVGIATGILHPHGVVVR
jgi:heme/copper-type cytochrome/quinol oxidase subunit 4